MAKLKAGAISKVPQPARCVGVASWIVVILSMVGLWLAGGCRRDPAPPPTGVPAGFSSKIRNVLLISLDTVRADYFGCYGYPGQTTPIIDALVAEGVLFEHVVSPVPMTLPAHCSLLTGKNPTRHGVRQNLKYRLGASHITLAELLKAQGFATGAIVASHVLDRKFGLDQGFDAFDDQFPGIERAAGEVSRLANEWIASHQAEKFLLWLHYFDPHAPFAPPASYAEQFKGAAHGRYAGEIAYVDNSLDAVLKQLRDLNLLDSTLVIVVGDHGESLGDHGEEFHSYFIYQSTVQTPMVFKIPGDRGARRISAAVSLIDVLPTVCGLLELDPPDAVEGENLAAVCLGRAQPDDERPLYFESLTPTVYGCNPLLGLRIGNSKLIQTTRPELYDLSQDPQESNNLADTHPEKLQSLDLELQAMIEDSMAMATDEDNAADVDEQTIRQLQALGYVGGTVDEAPAMDQSKQDPKDLLEYHRNYMQVGDLMRQQRFEEARQICMAMIQRQPQIYCGYSSLADLAMIAGKFPIVIKLSTKALELNVDDVDSHYRLAVALHMTGELTKAIAHYRSTLKLSPDKLDAHLNLGKALHTEGSFAEAIKHFREALRINPDNPTARQQLREAEKKLETRSDA